MGFELVIRGGLVVDGTGTQARTADVAVADGRVVEVGRVTERGAREIRADGALVIPGFVDIHTHYDGQAMWDNELAPSSWHGVTTVVTGNCGVGFAPVRSGDRQRLIELMEGVEDIPGSALNEGLSWEWESFEQYLNELDQRPRDIDLGAQVPHAPVRVFAMGERGADREPATPDDVAAMSALVASAVAAGALGFTTSRTLNHRSSNGDPTPTLTAGRDELLGIAQALGSLGAGVMQVVGDFAEVDADFAVLEAMAQRSGRPLSVSVAQNGLRPDDWRKLLDHAAAATARGASITGQVASRAIGLLFGFETSLHPFMSSPVWRELQPLTNQVRLERLRRPEVRAALVRSARLDRASSLVGSRLITEFDRMFPLGDPPDYEPIPSNSIAALAVRQGRPAVEVAYDLMLANDGQGLLYLPLLNFVDGNLDVVEEQLRHPASIAGLSDGGAHVGTICDVSFPTTLLQLWGRDRTRGRLPIELLVQKQTASTAEAVELFDRGILAPGYRADLNVIDFDRLSLCPPEIHHDLPAGGRRLMQRSIGYLHTLVGGVEVRADGESTGATPGRLVRGSQPPPTERAR